MAVTPQTNIRLLQVPLEIDNKNQLTFENKEAQFQYFYNLNAIEVDNCTYQRKDNIIRFPVHIDSIMQYNYVMYQNENYTNKWFYAFITNMSYINDNLTAITIATDVFQTWQFDIIYKQSFIEREMCNVADDVPGHNIIAEGLETGEFINFKNYEIDDLEPVEILAFIGEKIGEDNVVQNGVRYNGIYSSITFVATTILRTLLSYINIEGQGDKIFTVFTVPLLALKSQILKDDGELLIVKILNNDFVESPKNITLSENNINFEGYVPRNQKLRTYPYCYLGFNPPNGSSKIFRYEDFAGNIPKFKIISEINPNPTVNFIPQNYKKINGDNVSESVAMNGYPTISYKNDYYNTWLAQNSEIINLNMRQEQKNYEINNVKNTTSGIMKTIGNALTGNLFGAIGEGINLGTNLAQNDVNHELNIAQQMAQVEKQSMLPDTATLSGSNATLLGYNLNDQSIFTSYTIKKQFAERIDKFFDMFGYLTNTVKIPNIKNRPSWNYVKTIGLNVTGSIPQQDLQIIKSIFDNGVTLWHNPSTFLDYSQNNR